MTENKEENVEFYKRVVEKAIVEATMPEAEPVIIACRSPKNNPFRLFFINTDGVLRLVGYVNSQNEIIGFDGERITQKQISRMLKKHITVSTWGSWRQTIKKGAPSLYMAGYDLVKHRKGENSARKLFRKTVR